MIRIEIDDRGVATLSLARADKHNALTSDMIDQLRYATVRLGADRTVRVVVLAAEGPTFCAGGDLRWMQGQMAADAATRRAGAKALAEMLGALNRLPKPLIGRLQGNAFGGGIGLACVCDVAIGVEGAVFGLTETRLGLIPATIGPYVVARMGEARAREVFFSARQFDATRAQRLGILSRVVPMDALDDAVAAEVAPYFDCAPGAVAAAKGLVRRLGGDITAQAVEDSIAALVAQWETDEAREGITAFFEKRKADWMC